MSGKKFSKKAADHVCKFIETLCTHVKGEWRGQPLSLEKWQKDEIIRPAFGYKREDGTRQYRTVYVEVPRKNGKTSLSAAVGLYLLFGDGEPGAEVYSAAANREQAAISYDAARQMIQQSERLSEISKVFQRAIVYEERGSTFKVLSKESNTKHGLNASGIIIDELHAHKDRDLFDVLTSSVGSRRQPMIFIITTAGVAAKDSIGYEMHDYATKVRDGIIEDETFLPVIYGADQEDDPFDEKAWQKANPNFGVSLKKDYIYHEAKKAKNNPSYLNTFKRLHLNIWTASETVFIPHHEWDQCDQKTGDIRPDEPCFAGLDLSSSRDFTAMVLISEEYPHKVLPFFWIPEGSVEERVIRGTLWGWIESGYLRTVPGKAIDYDHLYSDISDILSRFSVREIAFDPWNSNKLIPQLESDGANLVEFRQGYASMNPAMKGLEKAVMNSELDHGGNPILRWMNSNLMFEEDAAGNVKPSKGKSREKIDGMVALMMAYGRMIFSEEEDSESIYEERGIRTIG